MSRALPEGYVAKQIRVIEDDSWVHVLASTPFGSHVEYMVAMPSGIKTQAGVCPLCVNDMKMLKAGSFVCTNGHVPVFMKTAQFTQQVAKQNVRRTMTKTLRPRSQEQPTVEPQISKTQIKQQVADALEAYL